MSDPIRQLTAAEFERALRGRERPADSSAQVERAVREAVEDARRRLSGIKARDAKGNGA